MYKYSDILFISPHHDDVAFSLSGIVKYLSEKKLKLFMLNVFSISNHVKSDSIIQKLATYDLLSFASDIRKEENKKFCKKYNISNYNLDLKESALFCHPFDISNVKILKKFARRKIFSFMKRINDFYNLKNTIIFIPLAIGKHRDHIITYNFMQKILKQTKDSNIIFYEDSPYINFPGKREERLKNLEDFFNINNFNKIDFFLDSNYLFNKSEDVKFYKSQIVDKEYKEFDVKKYCRFVNNEYCESIWTNNNEVLNFLLNIFQG